MKGLSIASLGVTLAAFLVLHLARGYPWQLALLAAIAIGALVYVGGRTVQNLRRLSDPDPTEVVWTRSPGGAPGKGDERRGEQQMGRAAQGPAGEEQEHPRREQQTSEQESGGRRHDDVAGESQPRG